MGLSARSRSRSRSGSSLASDLSGELSSRAGALTIPMKTLIATGASLASYVLLMILLTTMDRCNWNREKAWMFSVSLLAFLSTLFIFWLNLRHPPFKFPMLSLTASLFYSATAAIMLWLLVHTLIFGMCGNFKWETSMVYESSALGATKAHYSERAPLAIDSRASAPASRRALRAASEEEEDKEVEQPIVASTQKPVTLDPKHPPFYDEQVFLFQQGHIGQIICWLLGIPAVVLQIVAHFYYG